MKKQGDVSSVQHTVLINRYACTYPLPAKTLSLMQSKNVFLLQAGVP